MLNQCICTQVILIDFVCRKDENYYPKVFLEKHNFNEKIKIYSDDSYNVDLMKNILMILVKKILMKKSKWRKLYKFI